MAIKKGSIRPPKLTPGELLVLAAVESEVDATLLEVGGCPKEGIVIDHDGTISLRLRQELERRYQDAGWGTDITTRYRACSIEYRIHLF